MKSGQALLKKGNIMLISIYVSSLSSPRTVTSPLKVTRILVLGNSSTALCLSAGVPKFTGGFTE